MSARYFYIEHLTLGDRDLPYGERDVSRIHQITEPRPVGSARFYRAWQINGGQEVIIHENDIITRPSLRESVSPIRAVDSEDGADTPNSSDNPPVVLRDDDIRGALS